MKIMSQRTPAFSDSNVAGNEGNRQISSGIVGDLFNVLARPSRAVAGGALAAVDKNPATSVVGGITQGLTGHGQSNFSDVLGALGVKNQAVKSIGGFGLDVALDPLTYLGIKSEKGLSATEAYTTAFRAAKQEGENLTGQVLGDAVDRHVGQLMADNPAHLYVEFAGKKIGPSIITPSKVAKVIGDTIVGPDTDRRSLARMFSNTAELPDGLAAKARVWESGSSAAFQDHQKAIGDVFKDLSPDQRTRVSFALDEGTTLGNELPANPTGKNQGLNTLDDYRQLARGLFDRMHEDEVKLGIRAPDSAVENYVYKYFPNGLPETHPSLSKVAASRLERQTGIADLYKSPLRALANNPEVVPVTDIADMLQMRAAAHYRNVGRVEFVQDALRTFGVEADKNNTPTLEKLGWMNADDHVASDATKAFADQNVYLPGHIVKALNRTEKILTDNQVGGDFVKWYDKITHKWKFMNTVVNPGYWTRNSMSDAIMNFMDGVRNPKHYDQAFRIINEHKANNTAQMLSDIMGGVAKAPVSSTVDFAGQRIGADRVWSDFLRSGGKTGDITTNISAALDPSAKEGIGNMIDRAAGASNVASDAAGKIANWNNTREDYFRMAHFLSATEDQVRRGVPYDDAVMKAGERVRKYNIDYGSLSGFEKQYVRRAIPFYSWMRRNTPLQMELLLTRPGFMAGYAKGNDLMQGLLGTEDGSGDYLVPKWIRDSMPVRVALANNKSSNPIDKLIRTLSGAKQGESAFMPTISSMTPAGDIMNVTQPIQAAVEAGGLAHPGAALTAGARATAGEVVNMSTPFVKAPVEAAFGRSAYTGAPIKNWQDWLVSQVSPGRTAQAVTSGSNRGLTSALLGIQLQPVTAARQKGEFRRREDVLNARRNAAGDKGTKAKQWEQYLKRTRRSIGA
jgi:hypothetical protein